MDAHTLGEITLSISTVIYFIWFIPQIWLNYQRKNTHGLSLWMFGILFIGYSADLLYGFGREMQWQYRMVTIVGLVFLLIQHVQFGKYGLQSKADKINYLVLSVIIFFAFCFAVYNLTLDQHSKEYYNIAGFFSDMCWMTYVLPQIIKNFKEKSTKGLSVGFVVLSLVLSGLDITSTFALHWAWPSILSEMVTLLKKSVLIFQMVYYNKYYKQRVSVS